MFISGTTSRRYNVYWPLILWQKTDGYLLCNLDSWCHADTYVRVVKSTNTYNMGSCLIFCVCVCVCFMVKMTNLLKVNDTDFMFYQKRIKMD